VSRARVPRALSISLVASLLALAGCGGSSPSGVAPKAYIKSVCTSLRSWSSGIRTAGNQLQAAATGTRSLAAGKQQYQTFIVALATDTGRAVNDLKSAGVPAVKNGKQISDALVGAFTQARSGLSQAVTQAGAIPTTSAAAYQAAATGVTASIRQTLGQIATARPERDPGLRAAAAKEPACQALRSGTA
jgi:hypothetical protein